MDSDFTGGANKGSKKPMEDAKPDDAAAIQLALLQAFAAVIIFIPFIDRAWCPYAAALTGYSVLVFSMAFRDAECSLRKPQVRQRVPGLLLLHIPFLAAVYGLVSFSIRLNSQLPRFMTQAGRKGSFFEWIVTFALGMLAWTQERWMRAAIRRGRPTHDAEAR